MKYQFPNDRKVFLQNNRTDIYPIGNIWSTFSLDIQDNLGAIRVSPRIKISTSSSDDSDLGVPVAFKFFDTLLWAICDTHIFHNPGTTSGAWTDDASTGFQTNYTADESDMELFNGTLCATTTSGLYSKASSGSGTGAWTNRDSLSGGSPHAVCYFKKFNRLYYSDLASKIRSIDSSWTTSDPGSDYAIDLSPSDSDMYTIVSMETSSEFVWIGTINNSSQGGLGKVSQWDGQSAQVTNEFSVNNAQGILSIAINPLTDSPWVMDSNGILSAWTSTGFEEKGRLPFPAGILPYNVNDSDNERFIHPNGSYFTKNGTYRCLINNRANFGSVQENIASGVWEWSQDGGFQHVAPLTYNPAGSSDITDWGQNMINRVGALSSMLIPKNSTTDGSYLVGATIYTDASSTKSAIFFDNSLDSIQKKGYYISDWIESNDVDEAWERVWPTFSKFLDSNDRIVFKYRFTKPSPTYFTLTWVNTTSFTTTADLTAYWTTGQQFGGEIEVLQGTGSGSCSHITNIVNNAGTYTITLDTVITGVTTGTAKARAQNWTKIMPEIVPMTSGSTIGQTYANLAMGKSGSRVQMKCCLTYTGPSEFYRMKITSVPNIKIE